MDLLRGKSRRRLIVIWPNKKHVACNLKIVWSDTGRFLWVLDSCMFTEHFTTNWLAVMLLET